MTISLSMSNLKPARGAKNGVKRVGRGNASGKGTTAGRGTKGQKARTGGRNALKVLGLRRLVMSTPKLRGFKSLRSAAAVVSLDALERAFKAGDIVTPKNLAAKGLVPSSAAKIKILGQSGLKKKLYISGCLVSAPAKEKILAAGGEVR
jgi:large subunit ribosomal protein L15